MSEQIEEFVPESLRRPAPENKATAIPAGLSRAMQLVLFACGGFLILIWLMGYLFPPSEWSGYEKAERQLKSQLPLGSRIETAHRDNWKLGRPPWTPSDWDSDAIICQFYVTEPKRPEPYLVTLIVKRHWRWWRIE